MNKYFGFYNSGKHSKLNKYCRRLFEDKGI